MVVNSKKNMCNNPDELLDIQYQKSLDYLTEPSIKKDVKKTTKRINRVYYYFIDKLFRQIENISKKIEDEQSKKDPNQETINQLEVEKSEKEKLKEELESSLTDGSAELEYKNFLKLPNNDKNFFNKVKEFKKLKLFKMKLHLEDNFKINTYELSEIYSLYYPIFSWTEFMWAYEDGAYKQVEETQIRKTLTYILTKDTSTGMINELFNNIKNINNIKCNCFNEMVDFKKNVINFKDCLMVFDKNFLETGSLEYKIEEHTPDYLTIKQINIPIKGLIDIDNESLIEKAPYFKKFLDTSYNDDKERQFAIEKMAYTFVNFREHQELTYVLGSGRNGKGTYEKIMQALHISPIFNCPIDELADDKSNSKNQFTTGKLIGKPVLFTTEAKKTIKNTGLIKNITGGDKISIELKHKNININMQLNTKIFISTNHTVRILEWEKADQKRAHFLEMNNEIKEDPALERAILEKEINYVGMFIIKKGLFSLINGMFKANAFTLPDSHFRLLKEHSQMNNDMLNFITNNLELGEDKEHRLCKMDLLYLFNKIFINRYKDTNKLYIKFEEELKKQKIPFYIKRAKGYSYQKNETTNSTPFYFGFKFVEIKTDDLECEDDTQEFSNNFQSYALYNKLNINQLKNKEDELLKKLDELRTVKKAKDEEIRLSEEYKEKQRAANMGPDFYAQVKEKEDLEKIKTQKELDSFLKIYNDK